MPDTLSSEVCTVSARLDSEVESSFAFGSKKDFFQSREGRNQKVEVIKN